LGAMMKYCHAMMMTNDSAIAMMTFWLFFIISASAPAPTLADRRAPESAAWRRQARR
jgi:hypothetical protein